MSGRDILPFVLWNRHQQPHYPKDPAALHSLAQTTVVLHLTALHKFQERVRISPFLQHLPLADAILHHLSHLSKESHLGWAPASHHRAMTSLDGAFSNLGKYALNFEGRIHLSRSAVWKNAMRSWDHLSKEHQPVHQSAATANDILDAVNLQTDPQLRIFLILLWLLAGRKNDVAKLRSRSVELLPDGRIQVFVQEGKGVRARQGKYHIISHCPQMWHQELLNYLAAARLADHKHLFRASIGKSSEALKALRAANPALCLRSVRRGAAQTLAQDPSVSVETMMKITGHKSEKTLQRYLDWDRVNARQHAAAQTAARDNLAPTILAPITHPPPPAYAAQL